MSKNSERLSTLTKKANSLGLYIRTYAPGDGIIRYRFFMTPDNTYFGPSDGIYTALGIREAEEFVDNYG